MAKKRWKRKKLERGEIRERLDIDYMFKWIEMTKNEILKFLFNFLEKKK